VERDPRPPCGRGERRRARAAVRALLPRPAGGRPRRRTAASAWPWCSALKIWSCYATSWSTRGDAVARRAAERRMRWNVMSSTRTVCGHVAGLRRKLEDDPRAARHPHHARPGIQVRGRGRGRRPKIGRSAGE